MNDVGEQHRDLLVLGRSADLCDRCTALVTELGVRWQFGAARPTEQPRCGQSTATIPAGVHVSIVSCCSVMSVISPCISDTEF